MISRRALGRAGVFTLGVAGFAQTGARAHADPSPLGTQTFLKALPGRGSDLERFIVLNWLAMDRVGIDAGIFTHAKLFATSGNEPGKPDADYIVEVGYRTPGGYQDIAPRFGAIRRAHKTVLVNGLGLRDLGRIVGERQMRSLAVA